MKLMLLTDTMAIKTKPSAYSKVATAIAQGIKHRHKVAHTPLLRANKMGVFVYQDLLIYPSGDEEFGEDRIERNCLHFNADAVMTLKDLYPFQRIMHLPLEWIPYIPIDASPPGIGNITRLRYAFKVVSMSRFGYEELRKAGVKSTLIEHGVGPEYRPLDREACRRRFHIRPDEFIIGFVGKNQERKDIPRVIEIMAAAREANPDVDVGGFLWTNVDKDVPLRPIIADTGMGAHIHWPNPEMYEHGLPEENMAEMYNCFDLTIGIGNEGFWVPGIESMACGTPLVAVNYAAAADRVGRGCGYKVRVRDWTRNNPVAVRQPIVDVGDAVRQITYIINMGREAYEKRCVNEAKKYSWPRIIEEKWLPFLDSCEEELFPLVRDGKILKWDQEVY